MIKNNKIAHILIIIIISCLSISSKAQQSDTLLKIINSKQISNFMFSDIGFTALTEHSATDVLDYSTAIYNSFFAFKQPTVVEYNSLVSCYLDLRLNLIEYSNFLSISSNVPIGISAMNRNRNYERIQLGITIPLVFQVNMFNYSTKENENRYGFHIGAGYLIQNRFGKSIAKEEKTSHYPILKSGFSFNYSSCKTGTVSFIMGLNTKQITYPINFTETSSINANYFYSLRIQLALGN